jgi:hypothetical protein
MVLLTACAPSFWATNVVRCLQAKRVAENIEPLTDLSVEAAKYQARAVALGTQAATDVVSDDLKVSYLSFAGICG